MSKRVVLLDLRTGRRSDRPSGLRAVLAGLAPRIAPLGRAAIAALEAYHSTRLDKTKKTEADGHGQRQDN